MAYRRKYLLDSEIAEEQAKKWKLKWSLSTIALWAGGVVLLCVALLGASFAYRLMTGTKAARAVAREEFTKSVVGKEKGEVVRALGPPPSWRGDSLYYRSLTYDSATGKVDEHVMLTFDTKTERCAKVSYPSAGPN